MSVHAYHPETGHTAVVTEGQMDHMRLSGWVLHSEHLENEAARQAAEAAAAKKTAKSDEGK